jgi:hypothetical protein
MKRTIRWVRRRIMGPKSDGSRSEDWNNQRDVENAYAFELGK